jgi:hypothetical protein
VIDTNSISRRLVHNDMPTTASLKNRLNRHADLLLLCALFITFRLSSVWFFRPGGYIRDYSDVIFYQSRASWRDYDLLPYRDYWSEYPPLFAWLTLWIDALNRYIPFWEDERLWYVVPFGLVLAMAESVTFGALYWIARRHYGEQALRVAWLYIALWLLSLIVALTVMTAGYGSAYEQGATMTLASLRSLGERSGWSTLYAWSNGYTRLGKVLGDPFDPAANVRLYTAWYPELGLWLFWLALGALAFVFTWRQEAIPQSPRRIVLFAGLTYAILLMAYPAWNPQYVLYLLPFLLLVWPTARGLRYALLLSAIVLLEHPIYHNLLGPDYAPVHLALVEADFKQLFLLIISLRTFVLAVLVDDYQIPIQQGVENVPYHLFIGLYQSATGERLAIVAGQHPIVNDARLQLDEGALP